MELHVIYMDAYAFYMDVDAFSMGFDAFSMVLDVFSMSFDAFSMSFEVFSMGVSVFSIMLDAFSMGFDVFSKGVGVFSIGLDVFSIDLDVFSIDLDVFSLGSCVENMDGGFRRKASSLNPGSGHWAAAFPNGRTARPTFLPRVLSVDKRDIHLGQNLLVEPKEWPFELGCHPPENCLEWEGEIAAPSSVA